MAETEKAHPKRDNEDKDILKNELQTGKWLHRTVRDAKESVNTGEKVNYIKG